MRVDRFESTHYRNLSGDPIAFGPGLNFVIGPNGQGKTNLLEAIYFFRFGRSFRAQTDAELIQFDAPFGRVELDARFSDDRVERFALALERGDGGRVKKSIKVDGVALSRRADLAGRFPAVLFGPHDLRVVSGEPEHRRRFLDMVGTMTDPAYLRAAVEYRRVVEQRNAALKARASRGEMATWNERLVETGTELIVRRRDLAGAIERETEAQANDLGSPFSFGMRYESSLLAEGALQDRAGIAHRFNEEVIRRSAEEVRRGVTLVGPHRDDLEMKMDGQDVRKFGSQGQRRLLAVLIKLAEMAYLERELREPCVLLLDDVFSEFDESIISKLQRLLDGARQVFVTSPVPAAAAARAHILRVAAGRITPA